VGGGNTSSYTYSGLGDRLSQTVNSATTNYVLDLNAGLTQVLSDGTNIYLYGNGRIGELQSGGFMYHLGDALGSVRQLTDANANVTMAQSFDPYGAKLDMIVPSSVFGFAGEQTDSATGFEYLRTRFYDPRLGRFISRDTFAGNHRSPLSLNRWAYTQGNPINRTDSTGHWSDSMPGLATFALCFDFHSLNHGAYQVDDLVVVVSAQEAVDTCRVAYSKDAWSKDFFDLSGDRPTTGHDLFGWFLFEQGEDTHLRFDANQPLTKELSKSQLVGSMRFLYYQLGDTVAVRAKWWCKAEINEDVTREKNGLRWEPVLAAWRRSQCCSRSAIALRTVLSSSTDFLSIIPAVRVVTHTRLICRGTPLV